MAGWATFFMPTVEGWGKEEGLLMATREEDERDRNLL